MTHNTRQTNSKKRQLNENSDETKIRKYSKIIGEISRYPFNKNRLTIDFFTNVSCVDLAKKLLGQILCRQLCPNGPILKGRIVETESYLGVDDEASHSYRGRKTARNEPMFMSCGTCYVYFTYGMYYCFNLSADGDGNAVLIRALQPLECIDQMISLRNKALKPNSRSKHKPLPLKNIANGPSKLCIAMDINKNIKQHIATSDQIWLESGIAVNDDNIALSKRIGIKNAGEWTDKHLRFFIKNCVFVSVKH